jgi:GT2 family glycosyltransferase
VVIPTSRGGADLETCLVSLVSQGYPKLEVIVVDNASPDRSIARLSERFPCASVLHNEQNAGFVGASNQGIEASSGELILLLNDDTAFESGALSALVDTLVRNPAWGACQAKLLLMNDPSRLDTAGSFLTATGFLIHRGAFEPEEHFTASDEIFAAKGAALLVRRRAFEEVGALDADFFAYFEETDLCWRLWLAGWAVGFAADARVLHKLGATASALPPAFVQFHSFKNRLCTLLKNTGTARLAAMLPLHVALCGGLAAWYAARRQPKIAVAILRAVVWNAAQLSRTLAKRREIQARRRISDRELMPRISRRTSIRTLVSYARGGPAQNPGSSEIRSA